MCGCRHKPNHIINVRNAFTLIPLSSPNKEIVGSRMASLLYEYNDRACRYSASFYTLRVVITIGSLIVPALLSVQYMDGNVSNQQATMSAQVYWIVWVLSLLVTMSNGIMTLLKIDKKHFVMNTTFQHLLSESWQYIELSGRYSTHEKDNTHDQQYLLFCHMLEKIRMKQVQDEYFKVPEQEQKPNAHPLELMPASPANLSNSKVNGGDAPAQATTTVRRQNSQKETRGLAGTAFESTPSTLLFSEVFSSEAQEKQPWQTIQLSAVPESEEIPGEGGNTQPSQATVPVSRELSS
jgi:hypothetical protein